MSSPSSAQTDDAARFSAALATGMFVAHWAAIRPTAPAVITRQGSLDFATLNARCNQVARGLRARGVGGGAAVAILCGNRLEFAEVVLATRGGGPRLTPVNFPLTGDEAGYTVADSDAKVPFPRAP